MKKAFLINALARTITQVEVPANKELDTFYNLIGCRLIDYARPFEKGVKDDLIIDDEGMFSPEAFIHVKGFGQELFAGSGVVIGYDGEGGSCDVHMTLEELQSRVKFLTPREAVELVNQMEAD